MKSRDFLSGILSGIIIGLSLSFLVNLTINLSSTSNSYVDLYQAMPHYEFSTEAISYLEYLDITYKIRPPFYPIEGFNSVREISNPQGYVLLEKPSYDDCVNWYNTGNGLTISAVASQFKVSECSTMIRYVKFVNKKDVVDTQFSLSWRKDYENNTYYEEEGISIKNKINAPIKNYIFIYNQTNTSLISLNFRNCSVIKTYLGQKEIENRHNFFGNTSILAIMFDLNPSEVKELIVRCYH